MVLFSTAVACEGRVTGEGCEGGGPIRCGAEGGVHGNFRSGEGGGHERAGKKSMVHRTPTSKPRLLITRRREMQRKQCYGRR